MSKKVLFIVLFVLAVGLAATFLFGKIDSFFKIFHAPLPLTVSYSESHTATPGPKPTISTIISVKEVNLDVPFTSQAPHKNWSDPYQDFCEEASVLMAMSYIKGENISDPNVADAKMLAIKSFEEKRFGYHKDTDIAETAIIIKEFYKYSNITIVKNPSIADIKTALSGGKAVIIPVAGRELGNPYYTPPGPLYHMLVIKGYTKDGNPRTAEQQPRESSSGAVAAWPSSYDDKFITNDPGTRRGADFIYDANVLMNAIHDWNGGDVNNGGKVVLVVG